MIAFCLLAAAHVPGAAVAAQSADPVGISSPVAKSNLKPLAFEDVTPDGVLKTRAELSLRRLQEEYYQWPNISQVNFKPFPGDALGRCINGLNKAPGAIRYFDGPLLLGSATENAAEPLTPILDLLAPDRRGGEPYVYFPRVRVEPIAPARATGRAPNLAATALLFRRDAPAGGVPPEVGVLFNEIRPDRSTAVCGLLWPVPQEVRQVILRWPEPAAMPDPAEVVLRWVKAGKMYVASQPGTIGNGRTWVYTLGESPRGVALNNLVVGVKATRATSESLGIPEMEIPAP